MGKLIFGMMQSLDGYVAGGAGGPQLPPPGEQRHRHFNDHIRNLADVAGPELAGGLTALGLIDEYRLYLRPFVLGSGKPYFSRPRPPLRFISAESVGEDAVELTYVPLK